MTAVQVARRTRAHPAVLWAVGGAWTLAVVTEVTGAARGLHHGPLIESDLPFWAALAAVAFAGDVVLHRVVEQSPWLERRPWLLGGAVLVLAGAFQFSDLKQRCLKACRHPAAYLLRHYGRGTGQAFRIGTSHGLFCLGCCWALMLVSFAMGVANLLWMSVLPRSWSSRRRGGAGSAA